jgi:septal ring factor EnvC (AmiA/AmiB activator)
MIRVRQIAGVHVGTPGNGVAGEAAKGATIQGKAGAVHQSAEMVAYRLAAAAKQVVRRISESWNRTWEKTRTTGPTRRLIASTKPHSSVLRQDRVYWPKVVFA